MLRDPALCPVDTARIGTLRSVWHHPRRDRGSDDDRSAHDPHRPASRRRRHLTREHPDEEAPPDTTLEVAAIATVIYVAIFARVELAL